jgi:hypothetical protein
MDALVLAGYGLPPRLERKLLKCFDGERRPVASPFTGYDLESFALYRLAGEGRASPAVVGAKRNRRAALTTKLLNDSLSPAEDSELSELDRELDRYGDTVSPLPFDLLERLENEARLEGVDLEEDD